MKAIIKILGKIIEIVGVMFSLLLVVAIFYILISNLYKDLSSALLIIIGCPFMAYFFTKNNNSYGNKTSILILITILGISLICSYCIMEGSRGKERYFVENILLNENTKTHSTTFNERDSYSNDNPESTSYHHEISDSIVYWMLLFITIAIPAIVYLIIRKRIS